MQILENEEIKLDSKLDVIFGNGKGTTDIYITNKRIFIETKGNDVEINNDTMFLGEIEKNHEIPLKQLGTLKYENVIEKPKKGNLVFYFLSLLLLVTIVAIGIFEVTQTKEQFFRSSKFVFFLVALVFGILQTIESLPSFKKGKVIRLYIESSKESNSFVIDSLKKKNDVYLDYTEKNYLEIKKIVDAVSKVRK